MSLQANNEMLDLESDAKMKFFEERLASFDKTWPYDSNCNCSPEKVNGRYISQRLVYKFHCIVLDG